MASSAPSKEPRYFPTGKAPEVEMETLEDLLAEDGFKRLRSKRRPGRIGGTASAATASRNSSLTDPHIGSYGSGLQPERTRSDVVTRRSTSIMSEKGWFTEPRPTNFSGRKLGSVDLYEEHSPNVQDRKGRHSNLLEETMEFGGRSGKYHWYVNNVEELDRSHSSRSSSCSKDGHSENVHERLGHYRGYKNTLFEVDEKTSEKTITFPVKSDLKKIGDGCPVPSLDDASLKAIASILNSFVNQLIENGKSRSFLSQNCASSLKSGVLKERIKLKDGVISTLNEAIGAVEKIITDGFNQLEIKKTSLKLSVISGLTSMKSDDGCTSGIANSHLAACAHLYLSILYKIQKKDKVSAKHLLQVFCDSPHNARTKLLPELWDRIFLPQFSLLNAWYDEKVQSVQGTSGMRMKLEHLEKVHNEVLDTGTCQFAAYYMDWLMGDNMSPSLPSIAIPFLSFPEIYTDSNTSVAVESVSSRNSVPSHTMISRSLYESILSPSKKIGTTYEMESEEEEDAKYKEVETDHSHSNDWRIRFDGFDQENEETGSQSPNSGPYSVEGLQENQMAGSRDSDAYSEENEACSVYWMDETDSKNRLSYSRSIKESSRIPLDFLCPLTGKLLKDPVTLVSGFTFERVAIKEWFDQGNKTCPVTGQTLNSSSIPETNVVLKQMINEWIAKCFRDLSSSSEGSFSRQKGHCNSNFSRALLLIEQLLVGFGVVDEKKNIQLLMSLGGMLFLTEVIGLGSLEEQSHAAELLLRCIKADGCYRNYIAMNIGIPFLLELVNCKEFGLRNNAVLLLIELFWLKRMEIMFFLSGLKEDAICETMHELLACLQCSVPEERVLIAVLLLQFAQMVETQKVSGYKKEAIDCIIVALDCCLSNGKIIANCRRALLTLGGHFSSSGEILTETWLLKQAGYDDFSSYTKEDLILSKEESNERETWLKEMALSLLGYGKKLFVETLSKCLDSRSPDLVRVCLATTAWLSRALSSLSPAAFPASSFFVIILPRLKESLMNDLDTKNRVLASLSLLNFSRISEFRIPIITFADEIHDPLNSLAKVTWTAKMLYQDIFAETL